MLSREAVEKLRAQGYDAELVDGFQVRIMTPGSREAEERSLGAAEKLAHIADEVLDPIQQEIETQPIHSGYSPTAKISEGRYQRTGLYDHLPEADHKRLSMALKLRSIQLEMASLGARLGNLIIEMEDARTEYTGERLPDIPKASPPNRRTTP